MKKDFILTFLTQILILISGLAVFKLAKMQFGDIGFSEFSLMKRNSSYFYTFMMLGLGVAIPRYIAKEIGAKSGHENDVFVSAFLIMLLSLATSGVMLLLFRDDISFLLFGNRHYTKFLSPIFILMIGLSLHSIVYSYYRGKMIFNRSNFLQIINMGLVPLIVFLFSGNIEEVFQYTGLIISTISLTILVRIFLTQNFEFGSAKIFIPKLFFYGLQRLPADFGLASLIALPAIFAAHAYDVVVAGYVAFSVSLLSLSGQAVAPVGLIMLPKISHLIGEKNFILIKHYVKKLFLFSLLVAIVGTATYQFFADEILHLYLGKIELDLITISKNIMWGALFYPFYVTMRSVVDAYYIRPYNAISIFVSLIVFLILYFFTKNIYSSLLISLAILSLVTLYFIKPLLNGISK